MRACKSSLAISDDSVEPWERRGVFCGASGVSCRGKLGCLQGLAGGQRYLCACSPCIRQPEHISKKDFTDFTPLSYSFQDTPSQYQRPSRQTHPTLLTTTNKSQKNLLLPTPPQTNTMSSPIPTTFAEDSSPQDTFTSNYDLDNPIAAMSSYSRLMHQHTKRQMELATRSTGRRSDEVRSDGVSQGQMPSDGSLDSVDSLEQ